MQKGGEVKRVLHAEDSKAFRNSLKQYIEDYFEGRVQVLHATDGIDALRKLNEETIDLILTDLNMPRVSGYTIAAIRWKQLNPHADIESLGADDATVKTISEVMSELDGLDLAYRQLVEGVNKREMYTTPLIAMTSEYSPLRLAMLRKMGVDAVVKKDSSPSDLCPMLEEYLFQTLHSSTLPGSGLSGKIIRLQKKGNGGNSYMLIPRHDPEGYTLWSHLTGQELPTTLAWQGVKEVQELADLGGRALTHEVDVPRQMVEISETLHAAGYMPGKRGRMYRTFNPRKSS